MPQNSEKKWLYAQVNLAKHVIWHYLKKFLSLVLFRKSSGLEQFKKNYLTEGLAQTSQDHRKIANMPGNCTSCGICDSVCKIYKKNKDPHFLGPMRLVASGMRGGPIVEDIAHTLEIMQTDECLECMACVRDCPEGIPIIELSKHFSQQIEEITSFRK